MMKEKRNIFFPIGLGAVFIVYVFTAAFVTKGAAYTSRSNLNQMMQTVTESAGCECWWPIWAEPSAFDQIEKVAVLNRNVEIATWAGDHKQFHIDAGEPVTAVIKTFYYPRWQAEINSLPVPVEYNEYGAISLNMPAEAADVKLTFREPAYLTAAYVVSLTAWIILLISAGILLSKSRAI